MELRNIQPHELKKLRQSLVRFIRYHGDQRITHKAIRWLQHLPAEPFEEGTALILATLHGKIAGFTALADYGRKESFIVVHPAMRKKKVGAMLLQRSLDELGKIYTRVAIDNIPSLKLCFSCGLKAYDLSTGPTGKPTLMFGGGKDWTDPTNSESPKNKTLITEGSS